MYINPPTHIFNRTQAIYSIRENNSTSSTSVPPASLLSPPRPILFLLSVWCPNLDDMMIENVMEDFWGTVRAARTRRRFIRSRSVISALVDSRVHTPHTYIHTHMMRMDSIAIGISKVMSHVWLNKPARKWMRSLCYYIFLSVWWKNPACLP